MTEGATVNDGPSVSPLKYTLSRDLAAFELRYSLPHHHGVRFSLDDLHLQVDIFTYPKEAISPFRSLLQSHGMFKGQTTTGLLAFDYGLSADKAIHPGASGGIVVDTKSHHIVGVLNAVGGNGESIALADSVLGRLCQQGATPPTSIPSSYRHLALTHFVTGPKNLSKPQCYATRPNSSPIACATLSAVLTFAWGSGEKRPAAVSAYEVRVLEGHQRFRAYPAARKNCRTCRSLQ